MYMSSLIHLLEVSLVEGAHGSVIPQQDIARVQLEGTLKAIFGQLPPTVEHIHKTP